MRSRLFAAAMLAACVATVSSCRDTGADGSAFEVTGKLFVFNYRVATATYMVTLGPLKPMRDGQTAVATFEDPAGGAPIVVPQRIWSKLGKVTIESPPLRCVVKDRPYAVTIAIEGEGGEVVQKIDTIVVSNLDQTVLPDRPLVVGPVYTPNPELAGHADGKLKGGDGGPACPA